MKVSLKNRIIITANFLVLAVLLEIFTFTLLQISILPTYFLMDFGIMLCIAGLINLFPNEKGMVISSLIVLFIQTILGYLNITMFDIYGDLFSLQFLKLTKEARAAWEINFISFGKLFLMVFTFLIGGFFIIGYIRTFGCVKTVSKKRGWITVVSSFLVLSSLGWGSFSIQADHLSNNKLDKFYYLTSAAYQYSTLNIKSESFKKFGTYTYYVKEFSNVYLASKNISNYDLSEIKSYLNNEEDLSTRYEGLLENQNVIMIMLESVQPFAIDKYLTPNMYKLMSEGIYFDKSVSRNKTNVSEFIGMNGSYPLMKALTPGSTDYNLDGWSIVELLPETYTKTYVHANEKSYYQRGDLIPQIGFDNAYFFEDVLPGQDLYDWGDWVMDSEFMEKAIDYIVPSESIDNGTPFYSWWTTLSTHGPYGESEKTAKKLEKYYVIMEDIKAKGLWTNPLEGQEDEKAFEAYIAAAMDVDASIGMIIDKLEQNDILDETTLVLYGDHNCYYYNIYKDVYKVEDSEFDNAQMYTNPMIIYNQRLTSQYKIDNSIAAADEAVSHKYVSPYNIVPTLLDLLGLDYNSNLYVGTSVFYDEADYDEKNVFVSLQGGIFTYDIFTQNGIDVLQYSNDIEDEKDLNRKSEKISIAANHFFYKMSYIDKIYRYNIMKKLNK